MYCCVCFMPGGNCVTTLSVCVCVCVCVCALCHNAQPPIVHDAVPLCVRMYDVC